MSSQIVADGEAVKLIQELAVSGLRAEMRAIAGDEDHLFIVAPDGKYEIRRKSPEARCHAVSTLKSFLKFAQNAADGLHRTELGEAHPVVFVDESLSLILEDGDRRDAVEMPLPKSEEYQAVEAMAGTEFNQQMLIVFIRTMLSTCFPDAGAEFKGLLQNVNFAAGKETTSEVRHGRESMGRNIRAECTGTKALPETVDLLVRAFQVADLVKQHRLVCEFIIDMAKETFRLVPRAGELQKVRDAELLDIFTQLTEQLACPVYRGQP